MSDIGRGLATMGVAAAVAVCVIYKDFWSIGIFGVLAVMAIWGGNIKIKQESE